MSKHRKWSDYRDEKLRYPDKALRYLRAICADEEGPKYLASGLGNVLQARNVSALAKRIGVSRENCYRSFSYNGNPTLRTLVKVLKSVGMRLDIAPLDATAVQRKEK